MVLAATILLGGCSHDVTIEVRDQLNRPLQGIQISQRDRVGVLGVTDATGRSRVHLRPQAGQVRIEVDRSRQDGELLAFENPYLLDRDDFSRQYRFIRAFGSSPEQVATLIVQSMPSGASVRIDDVPRGMTPLTIPNLPVRSTRLNLIRHGYREISESVTLVPGRQIVSRALKSLVPPVLLPKRYLVSSTPGFAFVYVDGEAAPKSPPFYVRLSTGLHQFRLVNENASVDVTLAYKAPPGDTSNKLILDYSNRTTTARP